MKKIKTQSIMICSIAAVLLFSIGYIQQIEAGITQGTMNIVAGCILAVPAQDMAFGDVNVGSTEIGSFDVRNTGNQIATASIDENGPVGGEGDWVDVSDTSVIDAADTELLEGATSLGTLANVAVQITNINPDNANPGNNDNVITVSVFVNPIQSFGGALTLDITLVNDGCVANLT